MRPTDESLESQSILSRLRARIKNGVLGPKIHPNFDARPSFRTTVYKQTDSGNASKGKPPTFKRITRGTYITPGAHLAASDGTRYTVDKAGTIRRDSPKSRLSKKARRAARHAAKVAP
jgi:hypothetical protein